MKIPESQSVNSTTAVLELPGEELLNEWFAGEIVSEAELSEHGDYSEYAVYVRYNDG